MSVLRDFKRNQGLLLWGAVAYYTLLSIVPMSILALIGMSHFIEEEQLFNTLSTYLEMIIPGYAATLTEQVRAFLEHRSRRRRDRLPGHAVFQYHRLYSP